MTSDPPDLQALRHRLEKLQKQNRRLKAVALCVALCASLILLLTTAIIAQDRQPVFSFGAARLFAGMPKADAVASLSACCKLSPPAEEERGLLAADSLGRMSGHFIVSKDGEARLLGEVFFVGGKVEMVTRPLGDEDYPSWSEDAVGFARAFYRALAPISGVSESKTVYLSVEHERAKNADTEILSLAFPDGRGVRFNLIHLDKPLPNTPVELGGDKTEQVTLEEFLESPGRQETTK